MSPEMSQPISSPPDAPRVAPGDRRDIGVVNHVVAVVAGRVAGADGALNLFRVLGRHRALFRGWLRFAGRMMPGGRLPRADTELVILRVAHLADCAYEQEHHGGLARRAGLTDADVSRVAGGADAPGWTPRQAVLLAAVDELDGSGDLTDDTWRRLRLELDERQAIEFVLLATHYRMLATTIRTLRIPLDARR